MKLKSHKIIVNFLFLVSVILSQNITEAQTISAGNDSLICFGDSIQLGGNPVATGSPVSFSWTSSVSATSFSTDSTPTVRPSSKIDYYLQVVYSTFTLRDTVTISLVKLKANFGLSKDTICSGSEVSFYDSSKYTSASAKFAWNFGTINDTSVNQNPKHFFSVSTLGSGTTSRNVTLQVSDSGCSSTFKDTITVKHLPSVDHLDFGAATGSTTPYTNCVGFGNYSLRLINSSTTASTNSSYSIDWGDGSSSNLTSSNYGFRSTTSHTYLTQGYFYLNYKVTGSNGCKDSIRDTVFHGSSPVIGITNPGNTTGCAPYTLSFRINYRDTSGVANFPGTKYIITSNYPGFVDSVYYHPVSGMPDSIFRFTFSKNSCGYKASNTVQNGFYIEVKATNQCASAYSSAYPIHINNGTNARFTNTPDPKICQGNEMSFTGSDSIGTSISPSNPSSGCSQALKKYWKITPMTGVTLTSGSLGFNAVGVFFYGTKNIKVRFDSAGSYKIKYFLANYCGVDSFEKTICVVPKAKSSFTLSNTFLCNPDSLYFTNTSPSVQSCDSSYYRWSIKGIDNNCSPSSTNWTFIDSTNSQSKNPAIRFLSSGLYKITLYDSSYCGLDSFSTIDTVASKPELYFNIKPDSICINSSLSIDSIFTKNCYDTTANYSWTYTGGVIQNPTSINPGIFSTDSVGLFVISLTVTNRCSDTTYEDTIRVLKNPLITFSSLSDVCVDANSFTLNSASPSGGSYYSPINTRYIASNTFYPSLAGVGTHKIYYTYTDSFSCTSTDSTTVKVQPLPNTNAGNDTVICINDTIILNPLVEVNHTYSWYLGSSFLSNQSNLSVHPITTTQYILNDSNNVTGCTNLDTVKVIVDSLPPANAGVDSSICLNDSIKLGSFVAGYNYSWSSNPSGFSSSVAQPTVSPRLSTTYYLSVNAAFKCYNFDTVTVTVDTLPKAKVGSADTICLNDSVKLGASSISGNSYIWSSNPYSKVDSLSNPIVYPLTTTTYRLIETIDATGCRAEDSIQIVVNSLPNVVVKDTGICFSDTVTLSITPSNLTSYNWSPSVGLSSVISSVTKAYPSKTRTYFVSATDSNGCIGKDTVIVSVYNPPKASFSIDTGSCGSVGLLVDNYTDTLSLYGHGYKWSLSPSTGVSLND
ncbi:MAG: hypothetical protein P8I11_04490, partial [Bacteroidia bacterium]|nr:hypothetical protein [Bacteroidia bacterium]